jgi:hypothetical protein
MIDADPREPGKHRIQARQVGVAHVELAVPPRNVEYFAAHSSNIRQAGGPSAAEIEPHRADAGSVQGSDLFLAAIGGQLGDTSVSGAKSGQRSQQVFLVEGLERSRHHNPAADPQRPDRRQIVLAGKGFWDEPLVGDQGEPRVDDVEMGIEDPGAAAQRIAPGR